MAILFPSVIAHFVPFSKPLEGDTNWMYLDNKGLVTSGIGNLIDPIGFALGLPWRRPDGTLASQPEIASAWNAVKARQDMKDAGGGAFRGLTTIRLDANGVQDLVHRKLNQMIAILVKRFPHLSAWPADAQLGLVSMAWAMGPNFHFPKFEAAVNKVLPDFATAAIESHMDATHNPGLVPRNAENAKLFTNAAAIIKGGGDKSVLRWPMELTISPKAKKVGFFVSVLALVGGIGAIVWNRRS